METAIDRRSVVGRKCRDRVCTSAPRRCIGDRVCRRWLHRAATGNARLGSCEGADGTAITDPNADWPAEGIEGQLANFEVRDDGTIAPWLTLERHLLVLRGLWEHMPSDLYASITDPVLWISADNGQSEWTVAKRAGIDAALSALATSRSEWFSPAHHDVHAQHPVEVAALLHGALTDLDFF